VFLKTITLISWLMVLIQLVFQIILLIMQPYGKVLEPTCKLITFFFLPFRFKLIFILININILTTKILF
jgi:hypothetical protein